MSETPLIGWFVIGIMFGWFSTVTAVALGAYCVYRTKREPHESFFNRQGKGEAFNLNDVLEDEEPPEELPSVIKKMNDRFKIVMPKGKAFNAGEE